jgi:pimeloyl-ACP methyl ester carboxylesterase/DNA-binding CsgD family transcriptional regulator
LDCDGLHAEMRRWLDELEAVLRRPGDSVAEPPLPVFGRTQIRPAAILNPDAVSAAVVHANGRLGEQTPAFAEQHGRSRWNPELAHRARTGQRLQLELAASDSGASDAELIAYAPPGLAKHWPLPRRILDAALRSEGSVVMLSTRLGDRVQPLEAACEVYGLTGLQTRVAVETIRRGGIKPAAAALQISYQTAREALAAAMKRVGVERLPALTTRLTTLAFGVLPGQDASRALLADAWGLSERQIALAGLVAEGVPRPAMATALNLSEAVVRKELETSFAVLQVSSGAALARRIVEARALAWLTAPGQSYSDNDHGTEPLRMMRREDGTQIAWSDYGPASGRPVLVVHSSMTTRVVSRPLLRALHKAGYRPISIDRPGFGLSDMPGGSHSNAYDPWSAAAEDVLRVLDALKLRRVDLVARGGAQFVAALHERASNRLGRVVLVNPGPPYRHSGKGKGPIGAMKEAFLRDPRMVEAFAHYLAELLTYPRLARLVENWTRGSPPDQLAAQDPETIADFHRAVRLFAAGRFEGFVAEQNAISRDRRARPIAGTAGWRVLLAGHDVLYDPEVVAAYWRELLPEAQFTLVPDAGRFLAMTHATLVAEVLSR